MLRQSTTCFEKIAAEGHTARLRSNTGQNCPSIELMRHISQKAKRSCDMHRPCASAHVATGACIQPREEYDAVGHCLDRLRLCVGNVTASCVRRHPLDVFQRSLDSLYSFVGVQATSNVLCETCALASHSIRHPSCHTSDIRFVSNHVMLTCAFLRNNLFLLGVTAVHRWCRSRGSPLCESPELCRIARLLRSKQGPYITKTFYLA